MDELIIEGGTPLRGEVRVNGAKNASLPILVSAAAGLEPVCLQNVALSLNDVQVTMEALEHIGCRIDVDCINRTVIVTPTENETTELPERITGRIRSSLNFLGLLAGKRGHAKITFPGGCNLGNRKFDLHLEGLRQLGAVVDQDEQTIEVTVPGELVGTDIQFYLPTTTGTETVMLAACFAKGRTRIFNANTRPEVADMAACLNAMGARISVRNRVVEIEGRQPLTGGNHRIMPGWDEAMTYILAAGVTGGEICVRDFSLEHVRADASYLRQAGLDLFEWGGNVYASAKNKRLKPFDLFTGPYPGVNSDMQPLFAALASQCHGESTVTDQRFTERFAYVKELQKMGMQIDAYGNSAVIKGPSRLRGTKVRALDLRCGAALILAGLVAEGTTTIDNIYQIDRGYEHLVERFRDIGASIERVESGALLPLTCESPSGAMGASSVSIP